ncbi:MAG: septation protein IspZ [Caulobacteraceae bacterium]|nr:septation protein IspZ [Caulobacteraceae bacterium]
MSDGRKAPAWIRQAVDFGALLAFGLTYAFLRLIRHAPDQEALIQATWVLTVASAVALLAGWLAEKRLAWLPLISGVFALIFGTLTVVLHDADIIKMKITALNALFAAILLGGVAAGKNPGKAVLGDAVDMPDAAWRTLTIRYGLYFAASAAVNEVVWRTQSNDFWVTFKLVLFAASFVFALANVPFMMKHMKDPEAKRDVLPEPPDSGV